jgi:hypothetical protein
MIPTIQLINDKERVKDARPVKKQKQLVLHSVVFPKKGHSLFQINQVTGEIKLADFDYSNPHTITWRAALARDYAVKKRLIKKPDCVYILALNVKNAIKHYEREYGKLPSHKSQK